MHFPLLGDLSEGGQFVISNYGLAGCAHISIPLLGTARAGAGVRFPGGHAPGSLGELISNIHLFTGCDLSSYRSLATVARASAAVAGFDLPAGSRGVALSIEGNGGAPRVRLHAPNGELLDFTTSPEGARTRAGIGFVLTQEKRTVVLLGRPQAGHWTADIAPGSPAISRIRRADILPPADVTAHVSGRGARRRLSYAIARRRGQVVRLLERAPGALHPLKTVRSGGHGQVSFTVAEATGRRRTILAQVIQDGLPRQTLTVARFTAANARVGRVSRLRARRAGARVIVTWRRAAQATHYEASVTDGAGGRIALAPRPGSRRLVVPGIARHEPVHVTVVGVSDRGQRGPRATATLPGRPPASAHATE